MSMRRRGDPEISWRSHLALNALSESRRLGTLPGPVLRPMARVVGAVVNRLRSRAMRRAILQLGRAFPDMPKRERRRIALKSGNHLSALWADWIRLPKMTAAAKMARFDISALEAPVRAALAAETGAVIVTGRVGNWEGMAAALAAATGELMLVSRREGPYLRRDVVEDLRHACGIQSSSYLSARVDAPRWLKLNRVVIILADGDAGREGLFLPYFGLLASISTLPVRLPATTPAPCFQAFCIRQPDGHYRTEVTPLTVARDAPVEDQRAALAGWVSHLEGMLRAHPEQAAWAHRRWRTRPARDAHDHRPLGIPLAKP